MWPLNPACMKQSLDVQRIIATLDGVTLCFKIAHRGASKLQRDSQRTANNKHRPRKGPVPAQAIDAPLRRASEDPHRTKEQKERNSPTLNSNIAAKSNSRNPLSTRISQSIPTRPTGESRTVQQTTPFASRFFHTLCPFLRSPRYGILPSPHLAVLHLPPPARPSRHPE